MLSIQRRDPILTRSVSEEEQVWTSENAPTDQIPPNAWSTTDSSPTKRLRECAGVVRHSAVRRQAPIPPQGGTTNDRQSTWSRVVTLRVAICGAAHLRHGPHASRWSLDCLLPNLHQRHPWVRCRGAQLEGHVLVGRGCRQTEWRTSRNGLAAGLWQRHAGMSHAAAPAPAYRSASTASTRASC